MFQTAALRRIAAAPRETAREKKRVQVLSRSDLTRCRRWTNAFSRLRKDRRYYEIVEDTIRQGFEFCYLGIRDENGALGAIAPFFVHDQDLLAGTSERVRAVAQRIRRWWPRFMTMRTLMVGCAAGEGHLDGGEEISRKEQARELAAALTSVAASLSAKLIVLKEFPARYRRPLQCFVDAGYTRVPSFPMSRLNIDYADFEDYLTKVVSRKMRRDLRQKFRAIEAGAPIELTVTADPAPAIDEIYALYLQVYNRAAYRFEKLSKDYFCRLGHAMPDKVRFFLWRREGKLIAFSLCMVEGDQIYGEYLGFDYSIALDQHLYHYVFRDVVSWAMTHGYKWFCTNGANYDPKFHFRCVLDPLDLYVRHVNPAMNALLSLALPWLEPTRHDKILPKFPNYRALWE